MSTATTGKAVRRAIADQFKERTVPRGIFAVRCAVSGGIWIGSSPNLDAARNSLWFQLHAGRYRNTALQQAWNQHGEPAFSLDVVESIEPKVPELLLNDRYTSRKKAWAAELAAQVL